MIQNMHVVSNTSPLLNLAIIDNLSLLKDQFEIISIPGAVYDELRINDDLPGSIFLKKAIEEGWIKRELAADKNMIKLLLKDLDQGEAEAITLALQLHADWILLDERDARKAAKSLGLNITGVIGILLKAWEDGKIPSLKTKLEQLADKAGFRISSKLKDKILINFAKK